MCAGALRSSFSNRLSGVGRRAAREGGVTVHQARVHKVTADKIRRQINPASDGAVANAFLLLLLVLGQAHRIGMAKAICLPPEPKF
jgi:hypothetical protein